jgi:hypothetical protein
MNYQGDPAGICWFCNKRRVEPRAALGAILYQPGSAERSVILPRCATCKRIHAMQNYSAYFLIAVALLGSIGLAALVADGNLGTGIGVFLVSAMVSSFVGYRLQLLLERGAGVRNLRNVDEHPEVSEVMQLTGLKYLKYRK